MGQALFEPRQRAAEAFFERHDRRVAEQPFGLADVGLRIADVAGPRRAVDRRDVGPSSPCKAANSWFSEMRLLPSRR